ncbi:MAG: metalloregulator ArsR/SmtB family transcription factor [Candidatus Obscuribacterales bacterium]|nr:metalloregulator ArsR/SmtB family transcription factor [Candidatus Obscuribacterales bacterium]
MEDTLSLTFTALADPTRRAILSQLASGEASVKDLSRPFDISAPAITKHLKVLEHAGLITRSRDAQRRPCRLETKPLQAVATWVDQYKQHWEESFDRLDKYLSEIQEKENESER